MTPWRVGQFVHDAWWPWRDGRIAWVGKTRLRVKWSDGKESTYDEAGMQFLRTSDQ